jgi:hypothetical protein
MIYLNNIIGYKEKIHQNQLWISKNKDDLEAKK